MLKIFITVKNSIRHSALPSYNVASSINRPNSGPLTDFSSFLDSTVWHPLSLLRLHLRYLEPFYALHSIAPYWQLDHLDPSSGQSTLLLQFCFLCFAVFPIHFAFVLQFPSSIFNPTPLHVGWLMMFVVISHLPLLRISWLILFIRLSVRSPSISQPMI